MERLIAVRLEVVVGPEGLEQVKVFAEPNPLPLVEAGDTVVWLFAPSVDGRTLEVKFEEVQTLGADGLEVKPEERIRPLDAATRPCVSLTPEPGRIVGVVKENLPLGKRFVYKLMEGDQQVTWGNPMLGTENFGGMDTPQPPPRGG